MKNCWDLKKECPFVGTDRAGSQCPVYASERPCWEYDWLSFYSAMPEGSEKDEWKRDMLDWCARCEMRKEHAGPIDSFLEGLAKM